MKCIHCDKDCKLKERPDGRCPHCKHEFAFEPQRGDMFTDPGFARAIDRVSSSGKVAWGAEHLRHVLQRRRIKWRSIFGIVAFSSFIFVGVANAMELSDRPLVAVLLFFFIAAIAIAKSLRHARVVLSEGDFRKLLDQWQKVHGVPKGLIVRKPGVQPLKGAESDLVDYSFDRAVICDRARTVDLLIANNFHFENNCAVLSFQGYPEAIFETVKTMLLRNRRLKAFVVHDATPEGCELAFLLSNEPSWFKDRAVVVDVGLRPEHAQSRKANRRESTYEVQVGNGIDAKEAAWLSRYELEIAALNPEQIIKRLFRAMSATIDADDTRAYTSRDGFLVDRNSFMVYAAASDGGVDSFG